MAGTATSALLAGSPGALSQITMLAAEKGADVPAIAVVQTMRVIILTAALPLLLALTGIAPSAPPAIATRDRLAARTRRADRGRRSRSRCCCGWQNFRQAGCSAR